MTDNDVLVFVGPVVLAVLGIVTPFVAMKLRLRDARERIKSDLDLIERLPSEWAGRDALVDSVNTRLKILAAVSIPNGFRPDYYHAKARRHSMYAIVGGTLFALGGYSGVFVVDTAFGRACYAIAVVLGLGTALIGRKVLDDMNVRIRDRLPVGARSVDVGEPTSTEPPT